MTKTIKHFPKSLITYWGRKIKTKETVLLKIIEKRETLLIECGPFSIQDFKDYVMDDYLVAVLEEYHTLLQARKNTKDQDDFIKSIFSVKDYNFIKKNAKIKYSKTPLDLSGFTPFTLEDDR